MENKNELSFDGAGINGHNTYRDRVATFNLNHPDWVKKYGPMFAAAPEMLKVLGQAISRLAELDKILNPYVGLNTPIDDSAGRVLRSAHDVFIKAGGVCTCGHCRAKAEER